MDGQSWCGIPHPSTPCPGTVDARVESEGDMSGLAAMPAALFVWVNDSTVHWLHGEGAVVVVTTATLTRSCGWLCRGDRKCGGGGGGDSTSPRPKMHPGRTLRSGTRARGKQGAPCHSPLPPQPGARRRAAAAWRRRSPPPRRPFLLPASPAARELHHHSSTSIAVFPKLFDSNVNVPNFSRFR